MSQYCSELLDACKLHLGHDHLMLAAQAPNTWLKDEQARKEAEIALQKVANRSLYASLVNRCEKQGMERTSERVYRVHWRECETFENYVSAANKRQKGDEDRLSWLLASRAGEAGEARMIRRVKIAQTVRCLLGTAVESLLLVDRFLALLEESETGHVGLVALFDAEQNSPRNMALVVRGSDLRRDRT
jgi:hypothetical protein